MKRAEREPVDRRYVVIAATQELAKPRQRGWCFQIARRLRGKPQPDREWTFDAELLTDARQRRLEGRGHVGPSLTGVNVRAIGEIEPVAEPHCTADTAAGDTIAGIACRPQSDVAEPGPGSVRSQALRTLGDTTSRPRPETATDNRRRFHAETDETAPGSCGAH